MNARRVVVVGAGTAGCVVAGRLAGRDDLAVTLIEAGADLPPGGGPASIRGSSYLAALAEPGRTWPGGYRRGRGVGGTSAVNGMVTGVPSDDLLGALDLDRAAVAGALPTEEPATDELGPLDRALLAAAPDATVARLARRGGRRVTPADTVLGPARDAGRVVVRIDVAADRVVERSGRVAGVVLTDGTTVPADAVVVAAGALGSPSLLGRSGVDASGIGTGLADHPSVAVAVRLHRDAVPPAGTVVSGTVLRRGDVEVLPVALAGRDAGTAVVMAALMQPEGRGRVVGGDDGPEVETGWTSRDRDGLAAAEALVRTLLRSRAFADVVAGVEPLAEPGSYAHACCSCAAVVDDRGAVVGVGGLFVCDASTLPVLPDVGPLLTVVAWAQRFADTFA